MINAVHDIDVCDSGEVPADGETHGDSRRGRTWHDRRDIVRTACNVIATAVVVYSTLRGR